MKRAWVRAGALIFVAIVIIGTIAGAKPQVGTPPSPQAAEGLHFHLSEAPSQAEARAARPPIALTTPLAPEAAQHLLAALPPLAADPEDAQAFKVRSQTLPAPRPGSTVAEPFPPPPAPVGTPPSSSGELTVLRHAPEGNVALVPQLSVTFSQPMVAVTALDDLAAAEVPVHLTSQPPGKWRWIGTRTLLFEPADARFPMGTRYTATVPAGTRDALGHSLAAAVSWAFSTPPPQLQSSIPNYGPQGCTPLMAMVFDQKVDPSAVLATVHTTPAASLQLATAEEIARDKSVDAMVRGAQPGRVVAFKATAPFPVDTAITVTVGPGTPSAEGGVKTDRPQSFNFRTYGKLDVIRNSSRTYTPNQPWDIAFTNPIDGAKFDPSMIKVSPSMANFKLKSIVYFDPRQGVLISRFYITGLSRGRSTYSVSFDPAIRDVFGQSLGTVPPLVIKVGPAEPQLSSTNSSFILADPFTIPAYTVFSVNHPRLRVRLYSVTPDDWAAYLKMQTLMGEEKMPTPPGKLISNTLYETKCRPDELTESALDLRPGLHDGLGNVIVVVEPPVQPKERWKRRVRIAWIQSTKIGLDAFVDPTTMVASATSLQDGRPLAGVQVALREGPAGATDAAGLAKLALPEKASRHRILTATLGADTAFLPEDNYDSASVDHWARQPRWASLRWFVFDDRGIYKPNETVHFKGWTRLITPGPQGDVEPPGGRVTSVHYSVVDSRGNEVAKGDLGVDGSGGFDGSFKLPDNLNLGTATLHLSTPTAGTVGGLSTQHRFEVEEFRRPEFEVTSSVKPGNYFIGTHAEVTADAKYYAGGALGGADVRWNVTSSPGYFSPPGHGEFTFGRWVPWFSWDDDAPATRAARSQTLSAKTDAAGRHVLRIDFDGVRPPQASSVTAEATVMDVNRQAWSSTSHLLVHPASDYVGLKRAKLFVNPGEPIELDAIVADIDGKMVVGSPIHVHSALLDWEMKDGRWQQIETHPEEITVTSAATPVRAVLHPRQGGTWRVRATIADAQGRPNESEMTFWVAGGRRPAAREVSAEKLTLIPDKREYQPGDVAHVLVQAPFGSGHGVLTVARSGIVETRAFDLPGTSATLDVPIDATTPPDLTLSVEVTGAAERTMDDGKANEKLPKRPAFAVGSLTLSVPPLARKLTVEVAPRDRVLRPGAQTAVEVTVRDAAGQPVRGEVALVVVDEAVLALTGYKLDDPMRVFYTPRGSDVTNFFSRSELILATPELILALDRMVLQKLPFLGDLPILSEFFRNQVVSGTVETAVDEEIDGDLRSVDKVANAYAGKNREDSAKEKKPAEPQPQAVTLRRNFDALALFAPAVHLDAAGHALVPVKMPDNLTRYRVMAVAVDGGKRFGSGDSLMTARLPLMVRPSAPRFLNFGDRCELPVVVQNQTDAAMPLEIAARASHVKLAGSGFALTVPANSRVEVRFPLTTETAGTARFQVAARTSTAADAAEFSLPVYTPATTEAFATYGVLDAAGAVAQPVQPPSDVFPQFGGIEVELSSTALQALTDAIIYLVRYPYECAEQLSSRVIGIVALRDVLAAFEAKGLPDAKALTATVEHDVEKLKTMQNGDGGFAFWRSGDPAWPYLTVHVTNALVRAKEKGYAIPQQMLDRARAYLRTVDRHIPHWYPENCRHAIIAYALNVRWRMGDRDVAWARRLVAAGLPAARGNAPAKETLSVEAVGWLLPVLHLTGPAGREDPTSAAQVSTLARFLTNRATETAGAATFTTGYDDGQYLLLASDRRADAVVLEALIMCQPKNDLVPKIVRGLLAHRRAGRWLNTQENVFVLLALDRYFDTFEKQTPDFVARLWLGSDYEGQQTFKGRTTDRHAFRIPMAAVTAGDLTIDKQGPGRLYYRIGMQYAPRDLNLKPLDAGFAVQRRYEAVDDPADVSRAADGTYTVRAGARVRVRVTMAAPSRRYHVALVDPLPGGLEALNPALAVQGALPVDSDARRSQGPYWYWYRPWYEHQNLRDERAEAFTSLLWEGVYEYSWYARATTPGTFVVPPAKAEEMYSPEVFGRSATDRVVVK